MSGVRRLAGQLRRAAGTLRGDGARRVPVRDVWLAHEHYGGQRIATAGVVRCFESGTPDEYFTLDDGQQRIGLRGDAALLRAHVDRRVRVTGVVTFKPGVGIFLEAERVRPDDG